MVCEWIPFNQFNEIKEIEENDFAIVYSAIWKDGPLHYDCFKKEWTRESNKKVDLKCLYNFKNIPEFLTEV